MTYSRACIDAVKFFEGFRPTPYLCPAGKLTIGHGTTRNVVEGVVITREMAHALLIEDLDRSAADVRRLVKVPLTQGQFDALVSFAHNAGAGNLAKSTLLRMVNAGDFEGASKQFERWVHANGKKLVGLAARRKREAELFLEA